MHLIDAGHHLIDGGIICARHNAFIAEDANANANIPIRLGAINDAHPTDPHGDSIRIELLQRMHRVHSVDGDLHLTRSRLTERLGLSCEEIEGRQRVRQGAQTGSRLLHPDAHEGS